MRERYSINDFYYIPEITGSNSVTHRVYRWSDNQEIDVTKDLPPFTESRYLTHDEFFALVTKLTSAYKGIR